MITPAVDEHRWLQKLVGEWTYESECIMGPDGSKAKSTGKEVVRPLGDLWVIGEMTGQMPGGAGEMTAIITMGFDTTRRRFVGTWVGSPMASMFVYDGALDPSRTILTLDTIGPSCMDPGKTAKYQDIIEMRQPNERLLTSQFLGDDGQWHKFMHSTLRRVR